MEAKVRDIVRNGIAQLVTDFDWPDFQDIQMKRVKNNHGVFRSDVAIRWYHKNLKHCSTQCTSPWKTAEILLNAMSKELFVEMCVTDAAHIQVTVLEPAKKLSIQQLQDLIKVPVVYTDEWMVVIDKPANCLSVPGLFLHDSIETRVKAIYPQARMVHRLDYETSGVLVIALTRFAAQKLNDQFRDRTVKKQYVAVCSGIIERPSGTIELPLGPDPDRSPRQKVDHHNGRPSVTIYSVLDAQKSSTRVRLHPITGRTHQLRVHLNALGHPICGDSLYNQAFVDGERLHLHAETIEINHPIGHKSLQFTVPCPF